MFNYDPIASGDLKEIVPGQYAVATKQGQRWYGWLFYRHPDGQWVSLRKLTDQEFEVLGMLAAALTCNDSGR